MPATARHRASQRLRRSALVAAGALLLTGTLGGCGAALPPPNLRNIAQIQLAIQHTLLARAHLHGVAYCPATVPEVKGEVFSCVVALHRRAPALFTVTESNDSGFVTYSGRW